MGAAASSISIDQNAPITAYAPPPPKPTVGTLFGINILHGLPIEGSQDNGYYTVIIQNTMCGREEITTFIDVTQETVSINGNLYSVSMRGASQASGCLE